MKYRKKPVVIDAIVWDGNNVEEVEAFIGKQIMSTSEAVGIPSNLIIPTLEGPHHARPGDYIIRGVKNEYYPCKPDIFEMTYESAE